MPLQIILTNTSTQISDTVLTPSSLGNIWYAALYSDNTYAFLIGTVARDTVGIPSDGWLVTSDGSKLTVQVPYGAPNGYYEFGVNDATADAFGHAQVVGSDSSSSSSGSSPTTPSSSGSSSGNGSSGQSSSSRRSDSIGSLSPGGPSQSGGISISAGSNDGSSGGSDSMGSLSPGGPSQSGGASLFASSNGGGDGGGDSNPGESQDSSHASGSFSLGFDMAMPLAWQPVGTAIMPIY